MNSSKFVHGYGKVCDHLEDQPSFLRSPNRKPLVAFISVLAILFLTLSVGVTLGALIHNSNSGPRSTPSTANTDIAASIRIVCNVTRFPASCYSSISSLTTSLQNPNDHESIFKLSPRISAAMTDQETCLDGLEETEPAALGEMKGKMQRSREYTSNRKIQSRQIREDKVTREKQEK
ncbi:hypothetical protein K1719_020569 [Acacia pycnantha]|nr:hypothetical protein K1719_020569 [Acacia pycnantha]